MDITNLAKPQTLELYKRSTTTETTITTTTAVTPTATTTTYEEVGQPSFALNKRHGMVKGKKWEKRQG